MLHLEVPLHSLCPYFLRIIRFLAELRLQPGGQLRFGRLQSPLTGFGGARRGGPGRGRSRAFRDIEIGVTIYPWLEGWRDHVAVG